MYIYHTFFIHLLMVVCFHGLVIVNSASMNTGCMYVFKLQFCLDICPGVGLLDHTVALLLDFFQEPPQLSTVASPIYIPTTSVGGFFYSMPSPAFINCRLFDDGHSDQCKGETSL